MRRQRPSDVKLLAKEIATELRAKYDLNTRPCSMKTAKALGVDVPTHPAERGRVDQIPQRKKTGSPTAAMGQTLPSQDFCGTAALPLKPEIARRGWQGRKVPEAAVSNRSKQPRYSAQFYRRRGENPLHWCGAEH